MRKVTILPFNATEPIFEKVLTDEEHHSDAMETFSKNHLLNIALPKDFPYGWGVALARHRYVVILENQGNQLIVFLPVQVMDCQQNWFYDNIETFQQFNIHLCMIKENEIEQHHSITPLQEPFLEIFDKQKENNKIYWKQRRDNACRMS